MFLEKTDYTTLVLSRQSMQLVLNTPVWFDWTTKAPGSDKLYLLSRVEATVAVKKP